VALFPVLLMVKVVSTNLPFHTLNTEAVWTSALFKRAEGLGVALCFHKYKPCDKTQPLHGFIHFIYKRKVINDTWFTGISCKIKWEHCYKTLRIWVTIIRDSVLPICQENKLWSQNFYI
jgi:hypothetical protein